MTSYSCLDCKHLKGCLESSRRYPAEISSWQSQRY
nr:MAG TPA: hypothetical protein [Caudoviricetes sp.]